MSRRVVYHGEPLNNYIERTVAVIRYEYANVFLFLDSRRTPVGGTIALRGYATLNSVIGDSAPASKRRCAGEVYVTQVDDLSTL